MRQDEGRFGWISPASAHAPWGSSSDGVSLKISIPQPSRQGFSLGRPGAIQEERCAGCRPCRISSMCLCGMTGHPARGVLPDRRRTVSNRGSRSGRSFSAAATSLDALPEMDARHHTHRGQAPLAPGRYRRAHRLSSRELGGLSPSATDRGLLSPHPGPDPGPREVTLDAIGVPDQVRDEGFRC